MRRSVRSRIDLHGPAHRLRRALPRHRPDGRDRCRARRRGADRPAPAAGRLRALPHRTRRRGRPVHLAVGHPRGPRRRGAAPGRAGPVGGADRYLRRRRRHPALVARPRGVARGHEPAPHRVPGPPAVVGAWHDPARSGAEPDRVLRRLGAPLGAAVCAVRVLASPRALARVGPEVPDRRLARLRDPALRARDDLRRRRIHRLRDHQPGARQRERDGLAGAHGSGPHRHGPRVQDLDRTLPPVDPRRVRGRTHAGHRVYGRRDKGGCVRGARAHVRRRPRPDRGRLAASAFGARDHFDRGRQHRRAGPRLAQAPARLLRHRPGRLHARGRRRGVGDRGQRAGLLPSGVHADEPGGVRSDRHPRARDDVG